MGDFFGNLWQGLIGNGNGGGVGGYLGNGLNGLGSALLTGGNLGSSQLQAPGWMGGSGVPGLPAGPSSVAGTVQGANIGSSPWESDNQKWTSNGASSNWSTPVAPPNVPANPYGSPLTSGQNQQQQWGNPLY